MMLIGKKWDEGTVLRAAHAFEQTGTYDINPAATVSS
jgi:Asp-tRNA(Asn)/Glu-tRNA(Gln) amidotransferase A subunit family amidase